MSNDQDGPAMAPPVNDSKGSATCLRLLRPQLTGNGTGKDMERKMRLHEYRIAANRERRLRKADEKKQRKLNATILRRMVSLLFATTDLEGLMFCRQTRNPEKYNKNAERNRLRDIQEERRKIRAAAIRQVRQLAALHEPPGGLFNIPPTVRLDDGSTINTIVAPGPISVKHTDGALAVATSPTLGHSLESASYTMNPDRMAQIKDFHQQQKPPTLPRSQQPKVATSLNPGALLKPRLPEGVSIPNGEEDWLALWDISDEQIEKRIMKLQRVKAEERKAHRVMQQEGKAERREARDVKRKAYRDIKSIWKSIKG